MSAGGTANSINFTDTSAVTLSNTTSGSNQTLTLAAGGMTVGTGAVNIGSTTANQGVFIALAASQIWNIGCGGLTASNVISGSGFGITKAGSGTLTLNGAAVNTYTGITAITAGSLVLDFANLSTPTDLINNGSALSLGGGTLTVKGKSTGTTSQTFNGTTVGSGGGQILATPNGGTSTTVVLGALDTSAAGASLLVGKTW